MRNADANRTEEGNHPLLMINSRIPASKVEKRVA
jgi:hypothetical protein